MRAPSRRRPPWIVATALLVTVCVLGAAVALVLTRPTGSSPASASPMQATDRTVPRSISAVPLVNQDGLPTDLAALHGRVVILADFMTSCQEECPITTGALLVVRNALAADHLLRQVTIVEVTVDAARDTPHRLLAYGRKFGVRWTMLTGSAANLHRLWSWFGVWYERVPEGNPPATDWETGLPYTFDIDHSDALFVLGRQGDERFLVTGDADVNGHLPSSLRSLLDGQGRHDLAHPGFGSWSPDDLLAAVGTILGRSVPPPGST